MKEAYVSYETAKLLKEKGFNEKVFTYYEDEVLKDDFWFEWNRSPFGHIAAPTHQMACAWVREKGYHVYTFKGVDYWVFEIQSLNEDWTYSLGVFKEHDDAMEAALKYSLENLI